MSTITMVYMIKKIPIYIQTPIKEIRYGFIYLCTKKPHRDDGVLTNHFVIRLEIFEVIYNLLLVSSILL